MQDLQIIYDLVKETRDDVKGLDAKLNAHILSTSKQLFKAKAPSTFLKTLGTCFLWICALSGAYTAIASSITNKH